MIFPRWLTGTMRAPEFPNGLDWLNTDHPLSLSALRGKVVLLDFWTYGCINCMHVIPDLKRLERKYGDALVVIGVHSAKFRNEGETENLRQIILRYELEHPVVNDRDFLVWDLYAVRAWPTLVLIDPQGRIAGQLSGERIYEALDPVIAQLIADFDAQGRMDFTPLGLKLEREGRPASGALSFPGKVLADADGSRLWISDTNHHRLVVVDLATGVVQMTIGSGEPGLKDGDIAVACFWQPQGMALSADGRTLFVADTGNHAIRRVDLATNQVETMAGTGTQSELYPGVAGPGKAIALNSPWDVAIQEPFLYVAMAGPHQLWRMDLESGEIAPFAGSGREGVQDGPLEDAQLAQPSGLALVDERLYFADAEASAIRFVDLSAGMVHTLVGTGLFDFGDEDGVGTAARLQHALGIAWNPIDGQLYVADTYNSKIKRIDPRTRAAETVVGERHGFRDGESPLFYEPGGLSVAAGKLYVADTNNHAIREVDLSTWSATTLALAGLRVPVPAPRFPGPEVTLPAQTAASGPGALILDLSLPPGFHVNAEAPSSLDWQAPEALIRFGEGTVSLELKGVKFPLSVPVTFGTGMGTLRGKLTLYYCRSEDEPCRAYRALLRMPLDVAVGGQREIILTHRVPDPNE